MGNRDDCSVCDNRGKPWRCPKCGRTSPKIVGRFGKSWLAMAVAVAVKRG